MPFPYHIHELAYEEYLDAYEWYELKQKGLGDKFAKAIENRLDHISEHPEHHSKFRGNIRQAKVTGFPFTISYEFFTRQKSILIAAIHHTKRKPSRRYRKR
jgi:plasmid stabilization system protein ParE